jgi:hypothetical protein
MEERYRERFQTYGKGGLEFGEENCGSSYHGNDRERTDKSRR